MGIRFFCPNGHKLHVKGFQAGRRGICPHCGESMDIPLQSTRPSSRHSASERSSAPRRGPAGQSTLEKESPAGRAAPAELLAAAPEGPTEPSYDVLLTGGQPERATGSSPHETPAVAATPANLGTATAEGWRPELGGPQSLPSAVPAAEKDPLAELPSAVWYVRLPSGGQFGPASRDLMRTWIAEGRVSPDCLVWREGWRDWKEAGAVFPGLGGTDFVPGLQSILAGEADTYRPVTTGRSSPVRRKSGGNVGLIITIAVGIALLVVAAVLIWLRSS